MLVRVCLQAVRFDTGQWATPDEGEPLVRVERTSWDWSGKCQGVWSRQLQSCAVKYSEVVAVTSLFLEGLHKLAKYEIKGNLREPQ
jgi:hypothetical protein